MMDKFFSFFFGLLDTYSTFMDRLLFPHKKNCKCEECLDRKKPYNPEDLFNGS